MIKEWFAISQVLVCVLCVVFGVIYLLKWGAKTNFEARQASHEAKEVELNKVRQPFKYEVGQLVHFRAYPSLALMVMERRYGEKVGERFVGAIWEGMEDIVRDETKAYYKICYYVNPGLTEQWGQFLGSASSKQYNFPRDTFQEFELEAHGVAM